MEEKDVLDFYNLCLQNNIDAWIDGGWGVDALLEKQTRPHADLDIAIEKKNVSKLRGLLESRGYKEIKLEITRPHNFVLGDGEDHEIDIHVIVIDEKGNGIYGPVENGEIYPAESLTGKGKIGELVVKCISPEWVIKFHESYEPKEKELKDIKALCKKFNLEPPENYKKFSEFTKSS